ncbi:MAG: S41 family peptidase [Burkholderiales bacterium]|nr:S41 family peptidase [Burkholderiales bacterium]
MQLKQISRLIMGITLGLCIISYSGSETTNVKLDNSSNGGTGDQINVGIPVDDINNFARVYAITKSYYVESVTDTKLIKGAIEGMLTNLDPHSAYLDKDSYRQLSEMTSGSFAGLGIEVSRDKDAGGIKIIAPIDGTPAFKAGIKSGDVIMKIDGAAVTELTLDEAIKKMRGKVGTKVSLTISRKSELKPLVFNIARATIEVRSIKYTTLAMHYAYVRITNFQADTVENLVTALKSIYANDHDLKGLVLDLRDDPGGILQSAVGTVGAFIPANSLVVYTDGRAPNAKQKFYVKPDDYATGDIKNDILNQVPKIFKTLPIVAVVNQGTASAAEIVAGALQDYKRVKIIGTRTFGKGSVQTVIPLSEDTAVKLTTALYYTPAGRSIQAQGIKPDIIVKNEYSDLYDSWDLSEANLDHHIDNPTGTVLITKDKDNTPVITPPKQISTTAELKARFDQQRQNLPKVVKPDAAVVDLPTDFQLQWALNILEGKSLPSQDQHSSSKK